jgi:hypothetical protein
MVKTKGKELKVSIPAAEVWLYRNPEALAAVRKGLQDSAEGKTVYLGSFAAYAEEERPEGTKFE